METCPRCEGKAANQWKMAWKTDAALQFEAISDAPNPHVSRGKYELAHKEI